MENNEIQENKNIVPMKVYVKLVRLPVMVMVAIVLGIVEILIVNSGSDFYGHLIILALMISYIAYKCTKSEKVTDVLCVRNEKRYYYKLISMVTSVLMKYQQL